MSHILRCTKPLACPSSGAGFDLHQAGLLEGAEHAVDRPSVLRPGVRLVEGHDLLFRSGDFRDGEQGLALPAPVPTPVGAGLLIVLDLLGELPALRAERVVGHVFLPPVLPEMGNKYLYIIIA